MLNLQIKNFLIIKYRFISIYIYIIMLNGVINKFFNDQKVRTLKWLKNNTWKIVHNVSSSLLRHLTYCGF